MFCLFNAETCPDTVEFYCKESISLPQNPILIVTDIRAC